MAYEIDFIGVSEEEAKKDADAIAFRWSENTPYSNRWKVVVYDGGLTAHGKALVSLLCRHYFYGVYNKVIDAVILSHGDQDHAVGLKEAFHQRLWSGLQHQCGHTFNVCVVLLHH